MRAIVAANDFVFSNKAETIAILKKNLKELDDAEATAGVTRAKAAVSQASGRVEQLRRVGAIVTTEASLQTAANLAHAEAENTIRSGRTSSR